MSEVVPDQTPEQGTEDQEPLVEGGTPEGADAVEVEGTAEPEQPVEPTDEEKLEDLVQSLIAAAAQPPAAMDAMAKVSTATLLQMLGCEGSGQFVAKAPRQKTHPSNTTMLLLQRLSDEFRMKKNAITDAYEDAITAKKNAHQKEIDDRQTVHDEAMKNVREKYTILSQARAQAVGAVSSDPTVNAEALTAEVQRLERKILETETKKEHGASVSSRRLITFWKAKYDSLCSQFEQQQEKHFAVKTKLDEAQTLMGQSSKQLQMLLTVLREKEQKERHRSEQLGAAYLKECEKRGLTPEEPKIQPQQLAGALLSHSKLMTVAQHGWQSVEPEGAAADAVVPHNLTGARRSASPSAGSHATFTEVGALSPALEKLAKETIVEPKDEIRIVELGIQEDSKKVEDLGRTLEALQLEYSHHVANVTGPAASLLEEVITLQAQSDVHDAAVFQRTARTVDADCSHSSAVAALTEEVESAKAKARVSEEELRRSIREKEVDMVRVRGKMSSGQTITVNDFSDAPTKDPLLRLNVLKSRLAVMDCERQLLRTRLTEAAAAELDVMDDIERRLKVPSNNNSPARR